MVAATPEPKKEAVAASAPASEPAPKNVASATPEPAPKAPAKKVVSNGAEGAGRKGMDTAPPEKKKDAGKTPEAEGLATEPFPAAPAPRATPPSLAGTTLPEPLQTAFSEMPIYLRVSMMLPMRDSEGHTL